MDNAERANHVGTDGKRLTIGETEIIVQWPTPGDLLVIQDKMLSIAQRVYCVAPLVHVHAIPLESLNGPDRLYAIEQALALGAGGGVHPSNLAVARSYDSLEGLRFRLWRLTRRTHPELTSKQIDDLITEENRPDVIDNFDKLMAALDPKKKAETGTIG